MTNPINRLTSWYSRQKTTILLFLFLLTTLTGYGQAEENLVRQSFDNYKSAILNDNGEEAVKYVDSKTIQYYIDVLDLVKNADLVAVEDLSILDKVMVFIIRHRTSKQDILKFDGKSLLIYAIKEGMISKTSTVDHTIGDITINKDFAKGQLIVKGKATPFYTHFYKEENQWKVDLTAMFLPARMAFDKIIKDSGEKENDYLFKMLEMLTGNKPSNKIWQPIRN